MNYSDYSIVVVVLTAVLGGIIAVFPPSKKLCKFIYIAAFILLGVLGIYFGIQTNKENKIRDDNWKKTFIESFERLTNTRENNFRPKRKIEDESKTFLKSILSRHPGIIKVEVIYKDNEASEFAQEWYDLLKASGWEVSMETFIEAGPPLHGILIKFHGDQLPSGTPIKIHKNSSLDDLVTSIIINAKGDISNIKLLSNPTTPKNIIFLRIGMN